MTLRTTPFDAALHLQATEDQTALLADAFESGNETYIKTALATVARARGMGEVAKDANVTRQALYKSLTEAGDPKLSTLLGVIKALGMKVSVHPAT